MRTNRKQKKEKCCRNTVLRLPARPESQKVKLSLKFNTARLKVEFRKDDTIKMKPK